MSLKLDVRLTLTRVAGTHRLVPKYFLCSSDWLMRSELDYFVLFYFRLDDAATLNPMESFGMW